MLLVLAFVIQTLLLFDCLLRRLLQVFLPCPVSPLERYANANLLSTLAAAGFNAVLSDSPSLAGVLHSPSSSRKCYYQGPTLHWYGGITVANKLSRAQIPSREKKSVVGVLKRGLQFGNEHRLAHVLGQH